jgi:hypothetical protein
MHPFEHLVERGITQLGDGLAEMYARHQVGLESFQLVHRQDQPRQVGDALGRQQAVNMFPEEGHLC